MRGSKEMGLFGDNIGEQYAEEKRLLQQIAWVCRVDHERMFMGYNDTSTTHAQWLYLYAVRYMKNDTYANISKMIKEIGRENTYTTESVGACIRKMAQLIDTDDVWKRWWLNIKASINKYKTQLRERNLNEEESNKVVVVIKHPSNVDVEVRYEKNYDF